MHINKANKYNRLVFSLEGTLSYKNEIKGDTYEYMSIIVTLKNQEDVLIRVQHGPSRAILKNIEVGTLIEVKGDLRSLINKDGESELLFTLRELEKGNAKIRKIDQLDSDIILAKGNLDIIRASIEGDTYVFKMQYYFPASTGFKASNKYVFRVQVSDTYVKLDSGFRSIVETKDFTLLLKEGVVGTWTVNIPLQAKVIQKKQLLLIDDKVGWFFEELPRVNIFTEA